MNVVDNTVIDVTYDDMFFGSEILAVFDPYIGRVDPPLLSNDLWNGFIGIKDVGDYNSDGVSDIMLDYDQVFLPVEIMLSSEEVGYTRTKIEGDSAVEIIGEAFSADFDNDGDLDIFAAVNGDMGRTDTVGWEYQFGATGGSLFLRNNGDYFSAEKVESSFFYQTGIDLQYESGGHFGDIDNDGDFDIFSVDANSRLGPDEGIATQRTYLVNDGTGKFTHSESFVPEPTATITLGSARVADLNNDGIVDYVFSTGDEEIDSIDRYLETHGLHVYLNDGDGDISNDKLIKIPHHWIEKYESLDQIPIEDGNAYDSTDNASYKIGFGPHNAFVDFIDINNDGYLDIFNGQKLYNAYFGTGGGFQVFINDQGEGFTEATEEYFPNLDIYESILPPSLPDITKTMYLDVNGDGAKDFVFQQGESAPSDWDKPEYPFILINVDGQYFPILQSNAGDLVQYNDSGFEGLAGGFRTGDFNGDGAPDLLAMSFLQFRDDSYEIVTKSNATDWGVVVHYGRFESAEPQYIRGTGRDDILHGSSLNDRIIPGMGSDDIMAGEGLDTVMYWDASGAFEVVVGQEVCEVSHSAGKDRLSLVERLQFTDTTIALDLDGNAGIVAKILGAVFGADQVSNKEYAGIALDYLDNKGYSYEDLMELALRAAGCVTNENVVDTLYENVVGVAPLPEQAQPFVAMLEGDNPVHTWGSIGVMAADLTLLTDQIGLTGDNATLYATGLAYTPFGV